jgi:hypothetical protein
MLEAGLLAAGSEDVAQGVEVDLLANVELDQHQDRTLQGFVLGNGGGLGWRWGWGWGWG